MVHVRTQVGIVGAGPAGLLLGQLLHVNGIDSVIVENRSRSYVIDRVRAGVLEHTTVQLLHALGVGEGVQRGLRHNGLYVSFRGRRHRIPLDELTRGRGITIYGQNEVVRDQRRQIADLDYLTSSRAAMTSLAEQYVGLPPEVSFESVGLTRDPVGGL